MGPVQEYEEKSNRAEHFRTSSLDPVVDISYVYHCAKQLVTNVFRRFDFFTNVESVGLRGGS